jgi:hypothetical protein
MFAMRSFENIDQVNIEEWLQSDACELGFQNMSDMDTANVAVKQKGEDEGAEYESEGGESSQRVIHSMALQCADTLLDNVGQRGLNIMTLQLPGKLILPQGVRTFHRNKG